MHSQVRANSSVPFPSASQPGLPAWKRVIDITCCVGVLPLLAVSTAIAGLIVSVSSPGPIFYRQERIGYRGRRFGLYRLRTMHVNLTPDRRADRHVPSAAPAARARGEAERQRPFMPGGRFLRALRLAELPQFINVLRGDMTLVGPAPRLPADSPASETSRNTRDAFPGITGLWRTSDHSSN
jgi:lipopolysaccharide/colanic/teichoic acid biosynthesis glycosyltransferase